MKIQSISQLNDIRFSLNVAVNYFPSLQGRRRFMAAWRKNEVDTVRHCQEKERGKTRQESCYRTRKDALHRTQCESIETTVRTRRLLWAGALLRLGDHRLPKRVMSGELENAGKRGPGGKEKEWTDCVADDLRLFGVTGDWKTAALDPGAWYNTVQEGGCRYMAAWVREEENASNQRQKKRDAEEADKVEVAPGVTVASLRRFRTALIGPTQGLPKRRRLCR